MRSLLQQEHGRLAILGAVLVALVAGGLNLTNQAIHEQTEAATDGAAMSLSIAGQTGKVDRLIDTEFDVIVSADAIPAGGGDDPPPPDSPDGGYLLAQAWIHWENNGEGLELEFESSEITWPDCFADIATGDEIQDAGRGCITGLLPDSFFGSQHKGGLFTFTLTCPDEAGTHTIDLIPVDEAPALTSGSAYKVFDQVPANRDTVVPSVTSIQVNCIEQIGPTVTSTPTPKCPDPTAVCPTHTPTDTPTPTATPQPEEMRLVVVDQPEACVESVCQFAELTKFTLGVEIVAPPPQGYFLAQSYIFFGPDLTYDPAALRARDEIVWPDCDPAVAVRGQAKIISNFSGGPLPTPIIPAVVIDPSDEVVHHGCLTGLFVQEPSFYIGVMVEISLTCSAMATLSHVELIRVTQDDPDDVVMGIRDFTMAGTSGAKFTYFDEHGRQIDVSPKLSGLTVLCGSPSAVGGIALDSDLRPLPLETAKSDSSQWAIAVGIATTVGLIAMSGVAWYGRRRRVAR